MYEYRISKTDSIFYCGKDLPKFLDARRRAGLLKITSEFKEEQASAIEALTPKASEPEVKEETPKPVKKASKKSVK